jgi:hypothetical protein
VHGLHEYECEACQRSWLVARPKHQAKIVDFPGPAARPRKRSSNSSSG